MLAGDDPCERLLSLGPGALTAAELVALVAGIDVQGYDDLAIGQGLIVESGGLRGLAAAFPEELMRSSGVDAAGAASSAPADQRPCLRSGDGDVGGDRLDHVPHPDRVETPPRGAGHRRGRCSAGSRRPRSALQAPGPDAPAPDPGRGMFRYPADDLSGGPVLDCVQGG